LLSSLPGKKVGLALSSGGARGLAHIGVLEILERQAIPISTISGTSIGAIIGAIYAQGKNADEIKKIALNLKWRELAGLFAITPHYTGFLSDRKIRSRLKEIIGEEDFSELKIPFACVATDITTGERVTIKQGPVLEAVIASMLWPVIFRPVRWHGRYLVDGGIVDPVPVGALKDTSADLIIASNVIIDPVKRAKNTQVKAEGQKETGAAQAPNIFNTMMQFINITHYQAVERSINGADIIIKPSVTGIGLGDFLHASECIYRGRLAAQASMPKIKQLLAA
jgi:NTE family protein